MQTNTNKNGKCSIRVLFFEKKCVQRVVNKEWSIHPLCSLSLPNCVLCVLHTLLHIVFFYILHVIISDYVSTHLQPKPNLAPISIQTTMCNLTATFKCKVLEHRELLLTFTCIITSNVLFLASLVTFEM